MHGWQESRLANLLGATALGLADRLTQAAAEAAGASGSGAAALVTLRTADGIGGTELARRIGLSQSACTRMLDQLAAQGYVRRAPMRGRVVAVHLTPEGVTAADAAQRARSATVGEVLDALAPDRRDALRQALEPLLAALYGRVGSDDVLCRLCDRAACVADDQVCPVGAAARAAAQGDPGGGAGVGHG